MTHRDITLTEEERTAALACYALTCLAFVIAEEVAREHGAEAPWFYDWITSRSYRLASERTFGAAVLWEMRSQDREGHDGVDVTAADDPDDWLSYVEHVVGYRTGPGNGHDVRAALGGGR